MSLAKLFYLKKTFRTRVREWRQACFRRRASLRHGQPTSPTQRGEHSGLSTPHFKLESLVPRVLLSGAPVSLEPLHSELPAGSLIYSNKVEGATFTTVNEEQSYTLNVDAGQLLTTLVLPGDTGQQLSLTVLDPSSTSVGTVVSSAPGMPVVLNNLVTVDGLYTITALNEAGTGSYSVFAFLNTEIESEWIGGLTNDTQETAQDLGGILWRCRRKNRTGLGVPIKMTVRSSPTVGESALVQKSAAPVPFF